MLEGVQQVRDSLANGRKELERLQQVMEGIGDSGAPAPNDVRKAQELRGVAQLLTTSAAAASLRVPDAELMALNFECANFEAEVEETAFEFEVGWDI